MPIQLFTGIGAHDAKLPALAGQRFGFERAVHSLWALVFDFPYPNLRLADFSHANGVRELIASESSLRRLSRQIEARHNERLRAARDFFRSWLAYRDNPQSLPAELSFLTPELNTELELAYARYAGANPARQAEFATDNLGDRLYLADRYAKAAARQNYRASTMPDGSGGQRAVPVMTTDGRPLMDDGSDAPFRAEVQRQIDRRPAALVANQPAPSAPPVADADRDFDATDEFEKYDAAALAEDDFEAAAERERRQRASDDDNESIRAREIFDRVTLSGGEEEAPLGEASSASAPALSEEELRDAANERMLANSPEAPAVPLELSDAPPPPSELPGEPARRVGVAVPADDTSKIGLSSNGRSRKPEGRNRSPSRGSKGGPNPSAFPPAAPNSSRHSRSPRR